MRTDSKSVLPLSSDTPLKTSKPLSSVQSERGDFTADFKAASDELASKKQAPEKEAETSSSRVSADSGAVRISSYDSKQQSDDARKRTKTAEVSADGKVQNQIPKSNDDVSESVETNGNPPKVLSVNVKAVEANSGNLLQQEGVLSPEVSIDGGANISNGQGMNDGEVALKSDGVLSSINSNGQNTVGQNTVGLNTESSLVDEPVVAVSAGLVLNDQAVEESRLKPTFDIQEALEDKSLVLSEDEKALLNVDPSLQNPVLVDDVNRLPSTTNPTEAIDNINSDTLFLSKGDDLEEGVVLPKSLSGEVETDLNIVSLSNNAINNDLELSVAPSNLQDKLVDIDDLGLMQKPENISPPLDNDGELSWVLSQMSSSSSLKPANADSATVMTTVVAGANVMAGLKGKDGSVIPLSLLSESQKDVDKSVADGVDVLSLDDAMLFDEPIEFRKKEQEAMMGRMMAQSDGAIASVGGLEGASNSNGLNRLASNAAISGLQGSNTQPNLTMSVPPQHPSWASEMSQKVAWVAREGGHTAHIRLDPPELGSLTVKVSVDNDSNTQISFIAATPQARDMLESQMGRLREMLAQQGMDLSRADVDVSQRDASGAQGEASSNRSNGSVAQDNELAEDDLILNNLSYVSASGVDYYA